MEPELPNLDTVIIFSMSVFFPNRIRGEPRGAFFHLREFPPSLQHLITLGRLWNAFGHLWDAFGTPWGRLWDFGTPLGRLGDALGRLWDAFGAPWGRLGDVLGTPLGRLWETLPQGTPKMTEKSSEKCQTAALSLVFRGRFFPEPLSGWARVGPEGVRGEHTRGEHRHIYIPTIYVLGIKPRPEPKAENPCLLHRPSLKAASLDASMKERCASA